MSESSGLKTPFLIAIVLLLSQIVLLASLVSGDIVEKSASSEIKMMTAVYGLDTTTLYVNKSVVLTDELVNKSGALESVRNLLLPRSYLYDEIDAKIDKDYNHVWVYVDNAINNLVRAVNFMILRVIGFSSWLPLFVLLVIGSSLTGYLHREVKKEGFEYSSPMKHGMAKKVIITLPIIIYVIVVLPIAIHPYFYPSLAAFVALFVGWFIANTIKRV